MYTDRNGMCYCTEHRSERCGVCFFDFTVLNNMRRAENRGQTPDYDAVAHASYDAADAEMHARLSEKREGAGGRAAMAYWNGNGLLEWLTGLLEWRNGLLDTWARCGRQAHHLG